MSETTGTPSCSDWQIRSLALPSAISHTMYTPHTTHSLIFCTAYTTCCAFRPVWIASNTTSTRLLGGTPFKYTQPGPPIPAHRSTRTSPYDPSGYQFVNEYGRCKYDATACASAPAPRLPIDTTNVGSHLASIESNFYLRWCPG